MDAASLSKTAFAYLVMQLVADRTLDLDTPVYRYFPKPPLDYAGYRDLADNPRYKRITGRILLSHTSGLPSFCSL